MDTYTVFEIDDPSNYQSGLSLDQAATAILTANGRKFEIREMNGQFILYRSAGSANSPLIQALPSNYIYFSRLEIFEDVILIASGTWNGLSVMTDDEFRQEYLFPIIFDSSTISNTWDATMKAVHLSNFDVPQKN